MARDPDGPAPGPAGLPKDWPVEWQPVWGVRDGFGPRLQARALRALLALAARVPEALLRPCLSAIAWVAQRVDKRHTRAARGFLTQALGPMPEAEMRRRIHQTYRHFFRVLVEPGRFQLRVPPERTLEHYELRWTDDVRRAIGAGGCLLITGHIGNWEAAIAAAPWLGLHPAYAVAKPPKNRPVSQLVQADRERRGVRLLPRKGAMRDAPRVLRAGGAVGLLVDQRARQRPLLAPFFGRPARCDRSVGVLMKRVQAPAVICACYLTDRPLQYVVEFADCIWPEELREASPVQIATRINQAFEKLILAHPEQYFWIHDRYKKTPQEMPVENDAFQST